MAHIHHMVHTQQFRKKVNSEMKTELVGLNFCQKFNLKPKEA